MFFLIVENCEFLGFRLCTDFFSFAFSTPCGTYGCYEGSGLEISWLRKIAWMLLCFSDIYGLDCDEILVKYRV